MKAGKALNERKAEMRIQFKDAPAGEYIFEGNACPRNELGKYPSSWMQGDVWLINVTFSDENAAT